MKGRVIYPDVKELPLVQRFLKKLTFQGWDNLFLDTSLGSHENEVLEFYTNLIFVEDSIVASSIMGVELVFDYARLREVLNVPTVGLAEHVWKKDKICLLTSKFT